ncbi:AAA family ATPase [Mesorhizobium sp. M0320]|uniref:AAA family ATPase n=1 Tax=Mesorhizobium sp. M0320 TaxID=2956936 RepID=UPI0033354648
MKRKWRLTVAASATLLLALSAGSLPSSSESLNGTVDPTTLKIMGVDPSIVLPGEPVKIVFSSPLFEGYLISAEQGAALSRVQQDVTVQIGQRNSRILDVQASAILAEVPLNLPRGEKFEIVVFGSSFRIEGPAISTLPAPISESLFSSSWLPLAGAGIFFILILFLFIFFYRRNRSSHSIKELELQRQLEESKFRFERQGAPPAAQTGNATETTPVSVIPEVPKELLAAISGGACALFWGAGLSAQAGYPSWREGISELIDQLDDKALKVKLRDALDLERMSLVLESLATKLNAASRVRVLSRLWGSTRPATPAIDILAKLPFANVITSVWDPLVEQAFAPRKPTVVVGVSSERLSGLLTGESFFIVRLWGALAQPDSILFTANEYRAAVAGNSNFARYLASLALSQSHLFIGASLETIQEYLSSTPRTQSSRPHFALVPDGEGIDLAREVLKQRYGVELLVYKPTPGWRELPSFVDKLAAAVQTRPAVPASTLIEKALLRRVTLKNIGPFRELSIDLDPQWNVLLGNNGAGKSTVLRAIALVLCGDDTRAFADGGRLLRGDERDGFVQLTVGSDVYRTTLTRSDSGVVEVNPGIRIAPLKMGKWVALAFPPLRGVSNENPNGPTGGGAALPMVEDVLPILASQTDSRLASLKQWLVNLDVRSKPGDGVSAEDAARNQSIRDHFFQVFNHFIPGLDVQFAGVDRKTWRVSVAIKGGAIIGLDQISQGTSSTLGWVGALLQRMYEIHGAEKDIGKQPALVLIDEIDAHLHPAWQQQIVGTLSSQFPAVQFIATTHSPLVVGELRKEQIYWMERQPDGEVVASHPLQQIQGLGVAGLLESEIFGRTPTVDTATQRLLERQRALSIKETLLPKERLKLEELTEQVEKLGFRHQMRDPEFTEFLKERERGARQSVQEIASTTSTEGNPGAEVPPALRSRIKQVVARAKGGETL